MHDSLILSFERPPVVEVVCGLLFDRDVIEVPHFGLFWEKIRDQYPEYEQHPPLSPVVERFGGEEGLQLQLSTLPPLPRVWFVSKEKNYLVQLQADRLLHNWRKVKDGDVYPRFPEVERRFWEQVESFDHFLDEQGLERPPVRQLELTYVNHIFFDYRESDVGTIFPNFRWARSDRYLPDPEGFNWRTSFGLPSLKGRLHVHLKAAMGGNKPLVVAEFTARGSSDEIEGWFGKARECIVRGFEDLTSEEARKEYWQQL